MNSADAAPRCDRTGLHVYECAHCRGHGFGEFSSTQLDQGAVVPGPRPHREPASERRRTDRPETIPTVIAEINYLLGAFDHLVAADWVDEAYAEIRGLWQELRRAHGDDRPRPLGDCLTVTDGRPCPGKVMPDPNGHRPRCTACKRYYGPLDLVRLQITQERAG